MIDLIRTYLNESEFMHRNQTLDDHALHDRAAVDGCADIMVYPTKEEIPDRCAFVERQVSENIDNVIQLSTYGRGNNPPRLVDLNEVGGLQIFWDIDKWVRNKLATEGVCPSGN